MPPSGLVTLEDAETGATRLVDTTSETFRSQLFQMYSHRVQVLRHANRKHDVVAALITDPREAEMPPAGLVTLEDAETGRLRLVDTRSASFRSELAARARDRQTSLRDQLRATGMDLVVFDASGSMVDPLLRFFRERERRLRR